MQKFFCFLILSLSLCAPLFAQHAGDIELTVEGGKIVTGERVYGVELGEVPMSSIYYAKDPGFDSAAATFPFPSTVGFNVLGQLKQWNGTDFNTVATPRISISYFIPTPPPFGIGT